jgi:hypothetical protein
VKNYVVVKKPTSHLGGRVMMNDFLSYIVANQPIVILRESSIFSEYFVEPSNEEHVKSDLCQSLR